MFSGSVLNSSDAPPLPRVATARKEAPVIQVRPAVLPRAWSERLGFVLVAGELAVLLLLINAFELVDIAFVRVGLLAWVGFLVHHWLPRRWQMPFFAGLSVASVLVATGGATTLVVVGAGLGLIAVCHLPIAFRLRIVVLLLLGAALAALRLEVFRTGFISTATCAILGSLFMFRLIVYL